MMDDPTLQWMMWRIDDDQLKDPPFLNLIRAIVYYNDKYGGVPNRCVVPLGWRAELRPLIGMEDIEESHDVRPRHLMLAVDPKVRPLKEDLETLRKKAGF